MCVNTAWGFYCECREGYSISKSDHRKCDIVKKKSKQKKSSKKSKNKKTKSGSKNSKRENSSPDTNVLKERKAERRRLKTERRQKIWTDQNWLV